MTLGRCPSSTAAHGAVGVGEGGDAQADEQDLDGHGDGEGDPEALQRLAAGFGGRASLAGGRRAHDEGGDPPTTAGVPRVRIALR